MKRNITSNNVGGFTSTDAKCLGSKIAGDVVSEARLTREKKSPVFCVKYDQVQQGEFCFSGSFAIKQVFSGNLIG